MTIKMMTSPNENMPHETPCYTSISSRQTIYRNKQSADLSITNPKKNLMFLSTLSTTYMIMLIAEFGDKTQLVALSIMSKTKKTFSVALGATIGITLTTIIGILAAILLTQFFDVKLLKITSGVMFILIGLTSIKENMNQNEKQKNQTKIKKPFFSSIILVAFAELGDKSQLFVIGQAIQGEIIAVFLGATLAMATILFATAILGETLLKKIPEQILKYIAATLFILAGIIILLGN